MCFIAPCGLAARFPYTGLGRINEGHEEQHARNTMQWNDVPLTHRTPQHGFSTKSYVNPGGEHFSTALHLLFSCSAIRGNAFYSPLRTSRTFSLYRLARFERRVLQISTKQTKKQRMIPMWNQQDSTLLLGTGKKLTNLLQASKPVTLVWQQTYKSS